MNVMKMFHVKLLEAILKNEYFNKSNFGIQRTPLKTNSECFD